MMDSAVMPQPGQDRRTPGMEIALRRLSSVADDLTKVAEILDNRTAVARVAVPRPAPEMDNRPAGSELANTVQGHTDALERVLGQLTRISEEIDL